MGRGNRTNLTGGEEQRQSVNRGSESSEIDTEVQKVLESDKLKDRDVAWVSLIGSRAYGLSRPDSDVDLRGFYLPMVSDYLGIKPIVENIDFKESDTVIYELRKFIKMASAANPNILEVLWGEPLSLNKEGKLLQDKKEIFLSEKTVKTAYIGFIISQLKRAQKSEKEKERAKASLHLYRQTDNARDLLTTGGMSLPGQRSRKT